LFEDQERAFEILEGITFNKSFHVRAISSEVKQLHPKISSIIEEYSDIPGKNHKRARKLLSLWKLS
jgi:hypothetical protein